MWTSLSNAISACKSENQYNFSIKVLFLKGYSWFSSRMPLIGKLNSGHLKKHIIIAEPNKIF